MSQYDYTTIALETRKVQPETGLRVIEEFRKQNMIVFDDGVISDELVKGKEH